MRVLAIMSHPDDIEICCSGTLIKCVQRGDQVFACHVSDGNMGHMVIMPDELAKIRIKEAENAGKVAGYEVLPMHLKIIAVTTQKYPKWCLTHLSLQVVLILSLNSERLAVLPPFTMQKQQRV